MAWRDDLVVATRQLRRAPGWMTGVVLTLGLGIGLASAVFSIANALLLRPLPVRAQDRVVVLWGVTPDGRTDHFPLLFRDAQEFARRTRTLAPAEFFSYGGAMPMNAELGGAIISVRRSMVSGGYFELLGTRPLLGRAIHPADDVRGGARVAVLSYAGWQRVFGGDAAVIGRKLFLHDIGVTYTIVGVMPRGLDYPRGVDFWTPVIPSSISLGDQPIYAELNVIGRLRDGASVADARAELSNFFAQSKSAWVRQVRAVALPFAGDMVGDVRPAVLAFAAAAGLLLLITCINVANLLLVRGLQRVRELAVRAALGARRLRLVAQLLIESAMLAVLGGIGGAAFAAAAVRGFIAFAPAETPRVDELRVDNSIMLAAMLTTTLATLLFAVLPALVTSRVELQELLRGGTRQTGGRGVRRATETLVAGQIALALVVLAAAALVGRSLVALEHIDLAFDPARLVVAELAVPPAAIADAQKTAALSDELARRLQALPGVRSVTPVLTPPFAHVGGVFGQIAAEGQSADDKQRNPTVTYEVATPSYFATFGLPLLRGRLINEDDRKGALPVVVISQSVAQHYWPGADPIGRRFVRGQSPLTVVGVVPDTRYRDLRAPRPTIYVAAQQSEFPVAPTTLIIATDTRRANLAPEIRGILRSGAPGAALASAAPLDTYLEGPISQPKLNALLFALFALASLALAAIGLFGVMITSVRQRTQEIGVRVALGARPVDVARLVLTRAFAIGAAGAVAGLIAAIATMRLLRSLLFGVSATDVTTLALVSLVLLGVVFLAAILPARHAQRIDPIVALRTE